MKTLIKTIALFCVFSSKNFAQDNTKFWVSVPEKSIRLSGKREIVPKNYKTFELVAGNLKGALNAAPNEISTTLNGSDLIVELPTPDGSLQRFRIIESSIMEKPLADKYSQIKTYAAKGIDDPYAYGRLDWSEFGFHAMIRTPKGDIFIDPFCRLNTADYIVYYSFDFEKDPTQMLPEIGVIDEDNNSSGNQKLQSINAACMGGTLRTYRLAVGCTHEYAIAATGVASPTKTQTLAKVVTSVNRVNTVYETEMTVRLLLVAKNADVLYVDAASDKYTGNNNATTLISESHSIITATIGTANFDIGHTFSTGGGGLANLGCVCSSSSKGKGITGSPSPVGDPYDIDYVAHE